MPIAQDLMAAARNFREGGVAAIEASTRRGREGADTIGQFAQQQKQIIDQAVQDTKARREESIERLVAEVAQSETAKTLVNLLI
ncbi:MAG: hypothetical protein FJZ00_12505 [Candidatus Sericytochromatia bacterium]|uniref:Uncharacterized protein n=1 Tax=Candidatus Tanganyikabacteria bacterium TaxID=2961651 RepID=A0A937X7Y4_9BACT|nr:hypothetical protein [Candidatus Tanganyikabacteria bacterium]